MMSTQSVLQVLLFVTIALIEFLAWRVMRLFERYVHDQGDMARNAVAQVVNAAAQGVAATVAAAAKVAAPYQAYEETTTEQSKVANDAYGRSVLPLDTDDDSDPTDELVPVPEYLRPEVALLGNGDGYPHIDPNRYTTSEQ